MLCYLVYVIYWSNNKPRSMHVLPLFQHTDRNWGTSSVTNTTADFKLEEWPHYPLLFLEAFSWFMTLAIGVPSLALKGWGLVQ